MRCSYWFVDRPMYTLLSCYSVQHITVEELASRGGEDLLASFQERYGQGTSPPHPLSCVHFADPLGLRTLCSVGISSESRLGHPTVLCAPTGHPSARMASSVRTDPDPPRLVWSWCIHYLPRAPPPGPRLGRLKLHHGRGRTACRSAA